MTINNQKQEIFRMQHEIKQLLLSVKELTMLNEIAIAISSTLSLHRILDLIIQKCMEHLKVEQGAIMLLDEKEFGEIRLVDIVKENWNEPVETIVDKILQAVRLFTGDSPQTDDITLLIVKRLEK